MKPKIQIIILTAALFFWSCSPKEIIPPLPERVAPGSKLFSKADQMFQVNAYKKALELYKEYISRFPDSPLAPDAMLKTGTIHTLLGNNDKALNTYASLIDKFPDTSFAIDAKINILAVSYNRGNYQKIIDEADNLFKYDLSRTQILKIYTMLGNSYLAEGSPADAVYFYIAALKNSNGLEKTDIIVKFKDAVTQLTSAEILSLLKSCKEKLPKGYLMYQLGLNRVDEEKYDQAEEALSKFVKKFPEHENSQQAKELLEEIKQRSLYNRYTVGCLLPLSGPYKIFGNRALKGIELAMNQFSSQNIHPEVKILVKDTESDQDKSLKAVKDLSKEHVAAIIGPIITARSAALEAQRNRIPIITLTQKDHITEIGDYVFRNFLTPKTQASIIVSYITKRLGLKRFAILYPNEKYGTTFMNRFWDEVLDSGGKIVGIESYNPAHTDFASPIKKLVGLYYEIPKDLRNGEVQTKNRGPGAPEPIVDFDALFIPDAPAKAGLIIPQLAYYNVENIYLLGTNLWHSDKLIKMARQFIQGAVITEGFFAESRSKRVKDFVTLFSKTFGEKPGFIEAISYDTAMILFYIVSDPDVRFKSTLKNRLINSDYRGVTGATSFDENGDARKKPYLLRIQGDKFIEIEY